MTPECSPAKPCHADGCPFCDPAGYLDAGREPTPLEKLRAQLLDSEGLESIEDPEPLIPGVLYRDSAAWLYGEPGCGKSFLAIDIAGSVGIGEPWQGFGPVRPGVVLYLVAEGASGIKRRVRAWEKAMGSRMTGVYFLPIAVQAGNAVQWQALVDLAASLKAALIVIDTQARVTVGMEENSNTEMGQFVHRIEQLRRASKACVLTIHHTGRTGEHMRGAVAIDGAATTTIKVERSADALVMRCTKQKDAPEFDEVNLRLVEFDSSAVISETDETRTVDIRHHAIRKMLVDWWNSHETDWVSATMLIESKIVTKPTFYRSTKALEKLHVIEAKGEGSQRRFRLPTKPAL